MDRENAPIIIPQAFVQKLQKALESRVFVFISAHTGWGKTSVVETLLENRPHTYVSLWDRDALKQAAKDTTGIIVLDDFHAIYDYQDGDAAVLALLRTLPPDTRCILLSRAAIPEWLLPFLETGQMEHMPHSDLALDLRELRELLERMEFFVPAPDVLENVWELTQGNPSLVLAMGMYLSEENPLSPEVISKAREMFFPFLDRQLFRYWDPMEKRLLLLTSFFDSFTVDMARVLTGNPDVEQVIERLPATVENRYLCLTMARCRIRHQEYMEAYDLLDRLLAPLRAQGRVLDVIEALLLSAICRRRMGIGEDTWRPLLAEALELAQPYGYTALFAELGAAVLPLLRELSWPEHQEFLARLRQAAQRQVQRYPGYLAPFNGGTAYHPSLPADLLNEQEKMLFCSICARQTNVQIRKSLGISGRQLTRLTPSLYARLGAKSRKRIREMGAVLMDEDGNS